MTAADCTAARVNIVDGGDVDVEVDERRDAWKRVELTIPASGPPPSLSSEPLISLSCPPTFCWRSSKYVLYR
jgi:hypothetical protein